MSLSPVLGSWPMSRPDEPPGIETTTRSVVLMSDGPVLRAPCLTIAHHPDVTRIGQSAVLKDLLVRRATQLSRLEPMFTDVFSGVSAESADDSGQPLADPYMSRRPHTLTIEDDGSLVISPPEDRPTFEVDGAPHVGLYRVTPERLRSGIFLGLAGRIVLHLGTVPLPVRARQDDLGLVGRSESLADARESVRRTAALDVPVLILGETGTGKELVARALAAQGRRRDRPFIALNMATIVPATAVSELFGHQRGAFTGAVADRAGAMIEADGGTLFLDEVGLTPPEVQSMLLRALETGEVRPLGARRPRPVDVRLIAATDGNLDEAVAAGTFSEALYHRLSGYVIKLPPLRERREDIAPLVIHYLRRELVSTGEESRLAPGHADQHPYLPAAVMTRLLTDTWRGNVRRLQNVVRQMVIASRNEPQLRLPDGLLEVGGHSGGDPPGRPNPGLPPAANFVADPASVLAPHEIEERDQILNALSLRAGNQTQAARDCGISRTTFVDRLKKYGIKRPRLKPD